MQTRKREKVLLELNQQDTKIPINTYSSGKKKSFFMWHHQKIKSQLVTHIKWSADEFLSSVGIRALGVWRKGGGGSKREKFLGQPRKHHFVHLNAFCSGIWKTICILGKFLHKVQANTILLFSILCIDIISKNSP